MTSSSIRPNNFDLIRLIAAIQVVVVHGIEHLELSSQISSGLQFLIHTVPGVPVFFVTSGFLISRAWERQNTATGYFLNRAIRIYPALYVCFVISILSVLIASPESLFRSNLRELVTWIVAQLSFGQFFNPSFLRDYGVGVLNGSLWTIPVELQFYIALPIVYWMLCLRARVNDSYLFLLMFVFFSFSCFYQLVLKSWLPANAQKLVVVSMFPHFWLFLLGVVAQRNWEFLSRYFSDRLLIWLLVYGLCVVCFNSLGCSVTGNNQFPLVSFFLAGLVLAAAFSLRDASEFFLKGSDISYGIYIYHMVVLNFLLAYGYSGTSQGFLLLIVGTLVLAYLSWKFVEKPALLRKTRSVAA